MDVNEYLNAAWLGNTVRSWLFAVAILAAAVAALVGIKALVVGRFFKFATRTTNEVDALVVELPPTARTVVELAHRARVFQLMTPPAASSSGGAPNVRAVTAERAFSTRSGCGAPRAFVPE